MTYMNWHTTASLEEILTSSGSAFHISPRSSSTNLVLPFALLSFVGRDAKNAFPCQACLHINFSKTSSVIRIIYNAQHIVSTINS